MLLYLILPAVFCLLSEKTMVFGGEDAGKTFKKMQLGAKRYDASVLVFAFCRQSLSVVEGRGPPFKASSAFLWLNQRKVSKMLGWEI